ncbi:MAG: hypothetical protein ABJC74_09650 [Gemmatimonadota bacterium]
MPTRRIFKAVAHDLVESLLGGAHGGPHGSLFDHLRPVGEGGEPEVITVDLLTLAIEPPEAANPALTLAIKAGRTRLLELTMGVGLPHTALTAARIVAAVRGAAPAGPRLDSVVVFLTDDHGLTHTFECPAKWIPGPATSSDDTLASSAAPPPLADGVQTETPVTRALTWLEQFLPRLG